MTRIIPKILRLIAALLTIVAGNTANAETRPLVVVTVAPQAYFVKALAGELVETEVLLPPGTNHESYEPTIRQARSLAQAALVLSIGHPHFTVEQTLLQQLDVGARKKIVVVTEGQQLDHEDIHLWSSPTVAKGMVTRTAEALKRLDPRWQSNIDPALERLLADIDMLTADIKAQLAPHRGRAFLVFHPSWGYFAKEFGLVQLAIEHEGKEPGPFQLTEIVKDAKARGVAAVYLEPSFARESAEVVARELNARVELLDPMASDWATNLRKVAGTLVRGFEERQAR